MHPQTIHELRNLGGATAIKQFAEVGDDDGGAVMNVFGFPVIANPNMQTTGAGKFNIYLANWPRFVTIADVQEMTVQAMEQTAPGFVTLFAEKRLVSTVRDPICWHPFGWCIKHGCRESNPRALLFRPAESV